MQERNLFSEEFLLRRLSELGDPLEKLSCIDWEMFSSPLNEALARLNDEDNKTKHAGGRPPFDCVMMFKIQFLGQTYNISDDQVEYQITDRASFKRFLELTSDSKVPDAKTI